MQGLLHGSLITCFLFFFKGLLIDDTRYLDQKISQPRAAQQSANMRGIGHIAAFHGQHLK